MAEKEVPFEGLKNSINPIAADYFGFFSSKLNFEKTPKSRLDHAGANMPQIISVKSGRSRRVEPCREWADKFDGRI